MTGDAATMVPELIAVLELDVVPEPVAVSRPTVVPELNADIPVSTGPRLQARGPGGTPEPSRGKAAAKSRRGRRRGGDHKLGR